MAVPKKKTSKSRRNMRRSHHALASVNVVVNPLTGEYQLPHHVVDGVYNGKKMIPTKVKPTVDSELEQE